MKLHPLWLRWTLANALSEFVGLGLTLALTGWAFSFLENVQTLTGIGLAFTFAVLSGAIEATFVGLAQWWAIRPWFPFINRWQWWQATLIGALIAYGLGYLPSTLMNLSETATPSAPMTEPPQAVVLLLAAGLGAVGGAILSFAQWRVLRGQVRGAGIWIPANMLAWALGMPVIFWGIDAAFQQIGLWQSLWFMAASLLLAGAVVGAIHGAFLVRLAERTKA